MTQKKDKSAIIPTSSSSDEDFSNNENKCAQCFDSKCCQYITEPLDTPRSIRDFDMLLWQISHQNVHCFKDDTGWYLKIFGQCEHLTKNGQCGIYHKRPFICREHSNQSCELDTPHPKFSDLYFNKYLDFDQYCRKRFKRWDKRFD